MGEGGGQILRSALTLSVLTQRPFSIHHLRAGRKPPGLRPQHLEAVRAAVKICSGQVQGDTPGSQELTFTPGIAKTGNYRFPIPTAGCAALVLHTVYLPLALLPEPSTVIVGGGTHVSHAPCYDYLLESWIPWLARLGIDIRCDLDRAGFYPRGGGELRARVAARRAVPLVPSWLQRAPIEQLAVVSVVSSLPRAIAERQARRAEQRLREKGWKSCLTESTVDERPAASPGTMLGIRCTWKDGQAFFWALGERGKPAEKVADEAVRELLDFLQSDAPVEGHLADQLLLPLALHPSPSKFRTARATQHLLTNAEVIRQFLDRAIMITGNLDQDALVEFAGHTTTR